MNFREVASKGVLWGSVLMTAAATQLGACLTNEDIGISTWLTGTLEPLTKSLPVIVNVGAVVCMVGFAAGICNMTPAGQSTVNTVAIGSGWTDTKSMFVWGGVFAVMAILVLSFIAYPLGALVI